jgi:hypothetical protein
MKDVVAELGESEDETHILLDALVSAHYLALQLKILAQARDFSGRDGAEFLADALTEWAKLVENDVFSAQDNIPPLLRRRRH